MLRSLLKHDKSVLFHPLPTTLVLVVSTAVRQVIINKIQYLYNPYLIFFVLLSPIIYTSKHNRTLI